MIPVILNHKEMKTPLLPIFLFVLALPLISHAQLITTDPPFPVENDSVIVTFDATQGSRGLAGYTGDVYAHTGVITDKSTSSTDWKYVQADWGVNIPKCKMTRIAPDLYQLHITPTIRDYYGVSPADMILKMAFVFRSAVQVGGQWLEGKTAGGGDIFADVYEPGLNVTIIHPEKHALIQELNDTIAVEAIAIDNNTLSLYVNDSLIKTVSGNILYDSLIAGHYGKYRVRVEASNDTATVADSFYYFVRRPVDFQPLPEGVVEGINYINDSTVTLCLYAPYKKYVFAIGDFSNWEVDTGNYMHETPDSTRYWIRIDHLVPGKEYIFQYFVDGQILIGDPYAEKISDPVNDKYITSITYPNLIAYPEGKTTGIATVFQTDKPAYQWQTSSFTPPKITDLVVYELLVRDFTTQHSYQGILDTLDYLKRLGINAIELMPVMEFEGNSSWGYNPIYYFAPDKYYGPENKLKELIDKCHEQGLAVILDIVLNHSFGQSPMIMLYWDAVNNRPAANNPWYNPIPKHDFNVGYDFNHESPDTKRFVDRAVTFWLQEYRADGFRFDMSKGFTQKNTLGNPAAWGQLDTSRVAILNRYADTIWATNPKAFVILEHFAENTEETILANDGMILWGNENTPYIQSSMGYINNSDFTWASYKARGWNEPHAIVYMESHDEERMMYKNVTWGNSSGDYNIKDTTTALRRTALASLFFFTIPGPKMIWQFEELGYDYSINFNGRLGEKPVRWDYYSDWRRNYLYHFFATLITLKKENPVFESTDFPLFLGDTLKRINIAGNPMSVSIIGNFGVKEGSIDPNFLHPGSWYEYFTRDSLAVSDMHAPILLQPGEYRFYTDYKLAKPDLNTGIDDHDRQQSGGDDRLLNVYPNPSGAGVNMDITVKEEGKVRFEIYDAMGSEVNILMDQRIPAGTHHLYWDGTDSHGRRLKAGVYIYLLREGEGQQNGKIILLR